MLTNDSKKVLYALYSEYKARRAVGSSKSDARFFGSAQSIQENFFPDWLLEDLEDSLRELDRSGFLNNLYADDTIYHCCLSCSAIAPMENLPKELLKDVLSFASHFIP